MKRWLYGMAGCVGAIFCAQIAFAAGSEMEILLKKLQQKGILNAAEADEIAQETRQAAAEAQKAEGQKAAAAKAEMKAEVKAEAKSELPDWIKNSKFKGDLRLRYEARDREDDQRGTQGRGRFRLRAGVDTTVAENITVGFGMISGTGDQRSGNQTMSNAFTKKSVWFDYAYAKYAPAKWFSVTGGKFANPVWQPFDMLVSNDINPEGAAVRFEGQPATNVNLFFNGGIFVLDDRNGASTGSTADPLMYAFQPGVKWNITKDTFVRFAPTYYAFANQQGANVLATSSQNGTGTPSASNTNTAVGGKYKYDYTAINWGGEMGMNKPFGTSFIPYAGIMAGYIQNPDPSHNNTGYLAGFTIGSQEIKKFGDWSLEYTFRRLEKDAWLDILPESSFYNGNTNVMGHRVKLLFGLAKNTSFGLNFYDTWKIRTYNPTSSSTIPTSTRKNSGEEYLVQGDVIFKF